MPNLGRMNPAMMKKLKKQMATKDYDDVVEVIIKRQNETLVFKQPAVSEMNLMGQRTFQVMGNPEILTGAQAATVAAAGGEAAEDAGPFVPQEDIEMVAEQTGVSPEKAKAALIKTGGDIAEAIMSFL